VDQQWESENEREIENHRARQASEYHSIIVGNEAVLFRARSCIAGSPCCQRYGERSIGKIQHVKREVRVRSPAEVPNVWLYPGGIFRGLSPCTSCLIGRHSGLAVDHALAAMSG
jgi:hypothetical protein